MEKKTNNRIINYTYLTYIHTYVLSACLVKNPNMFSVAKKNWKREHWEMVYLARAEKKSRADLKIHSLYNQVLFWAETKCVRWDFVKQDRWGGVYWSVTPSNPAGFSYNLFIFNQVNLIVFMILLCLNFICNDAKINWLRDKLCPKYQPKDPK